MPYIPKIKIGNTEYNLKDTEARTQIATTNTNLANTNTSLTNTINSKDTALRTLITNTNTSLTNAINSAGNDIKTIINSDREMLRRDWKTGDHLTGLFANVEKIDNATIKNKITASLASGSYRGCALLNATEMTFNRILSANADEIVLSVSVISQQYYVLALSFSDSHFGELVGCLLGPNSQSYKVYSGSKYLDNTFNGVYHSANDVMVTISYKGKGEYDVTAASSSSNSFYTMNFTLVSNLLTVNGKQIGFDYQDIGFIVESGGSPASVSLKVEQSIPETQWTNKNWFTFGDTVALSYHQIVVNETGVNMTNYSQPKKGLAQLKDDYTEMIGTGVTPDLITIFAGVYDFFNNVAISEVETGLRTILEGLYTAFPNALIIVITPLPSRTAFETNTQGKYLADYASSIKAVAEEYLTPCLDLYSCSGINSFNVTTKMGAPTSSGPGIISTKYVNAIGQLISRFILNYGPCYN